MNEKTGGTGLSAESEKVNTLATQVDVHKALVGTRQAGAAWSRRSLLAAAEFLGGISNASAGAFHSLGSALEPEAVAERGLGASFVRGLVYGNARYFEVLAQTSTRVLDAITGPDGLD